MEDQIKTVALELIDRPVKISRETIDPERVRELAESIREVGLLQPVVLRAVNGRYEMVAGDRRYLAHKLLGLKEIKALVKELDDRETVVIRGIENLQRVNLTIAEEAHVYLVLKEEGGLSYVEIAKKTGKAKSTIERYIKYARCPEEVRRLFDSSKLSLSVLETLQEIDDPEIFMMYLKDAVFNGITPKVARMWVDEYEKTKQGTLYSEEGGVPVPSVDIEQKPIFMTCEVCLGPTEIRAVRNIAICPECAKKVKGSRVVKS